MKERGLNLIAPPDVGQESLQIVIVDICSGNIDRDGDQRHPPQFPVVDGGGHFLPNILVQPGDKAVALKKRDKFFGGEKPQRRVIPTHQRLRTANAVAAQAEFRLIKNLELPGVQRRLHAVFQRLFPQPRLTQLIVVNSHCPTILSPDGIAGQQRPVTHPFHRQVDVRDGVNAPLHGEAFYAGLSADSCRSTAQCRLQIEGSPLDHAHKDICM
ncbi:hypothetical protein SDC9_76932 [bioreactor metagenome]|uniref:Uncharacterized protein n=1 Tax=bioreactor metagenome TaxID=1076179 RepID=A0A644YWJ2_9ZZZZ